MAKLKKRIDNASALKWKLEVKFRAIQDDCDHEYPICPIPDNLITIKEINKYWFNVMTKEQRAEWENKKSICIKCGFDKGDYYE